MITQAVVSLLKPGSLLRDEQGQILDSRSSVTLVQSGGQRIIVDTGLKGEEKMILDSLAQKRLGPGDIDVVVNTHSHPDHCGNNHLFCKAQIISPIEGDTLAPGVRIIGTPGHTLDSISVVVQSTMTAVIAGDALPTFSNYLKSLPPALNVDRNLALSSLNRITKIADIVIPGHDMPFSIYDKRYITLPD